MGDRTERHAYGTSLGCIGQRHFVVFASFLLAVLSVFQLLAIVSNSYLTTELVDGESSGGRIDLNCVGTDCYEVWTCHGMRQTTEHIQDPFMAIFGALFFSVGCVSAFYGWRRPLRYCAAYAFAVGLVYLGCLVFDWVYAETCDAYTTNTIHFSLTKTLPPSPLSTATKDTLKDMQSYPRAEVDDITDGFKVLLWHACFTGIIAVFVLYLAREAYHLVMMLEVGPLGLGVHYGLDQWDQAVNLDAIRRQKSREMQSKFIDDATLPLYNASELRSPPGYKPTRTLIHASRYGSTKAGPADLEELTPWLEEEKEKHFEEEQSKDDLVEKPVMPAKLDHQTAEDIQREEAKLFWEEAANFQEDFATTVAEDQQFQREEALEEARAITAEWATDHKEV